MKQIISKNLHFPQDSSDYFTWDFRLSDGSLASNYRIRYCDFDPKSIDFVASYGFEVYNFSESNRSVFVVLR